MDKRPLAEGPLAVVQSFINTHDLLDAPHEELTSPAALAAWLGKHDLPAPAHPTPADLERALEVREALRAVMATRAGAAPDPGAARTLNQSVARAGLHPSFGADAVVSIRPGRDLAGVDAALAQLLAVAASAAADGTWLRLKTCANDDCRWVFYDRSRNHAGRWCDMATCGARHKMRAYRARSRPRT